jgi:hypothetical protein
VGVWSGEHYWRARSGRRGIDALVLPFQLRETSYELARTGVRDDGGASIHYRAGSWRGALPRWAEIALILSWIPGHVPSPVTPKSRVVPDGVRKAQGPGIPVPAKRERMIPGRRA